MRHSILSASILAAACAAPLAAMDSHIVGPRAMGLGGAGTAATDDHNASYYNPGMYGFFSRTGDEDAKLDADPNYVGRKDWGIGFLDVTAGVEVRGKLADYVQQIAGTDMTRLNNLGSASATSEDLKTAVATAALLQTFTPKSDNALIEANAGVLNTRILHVGIGIRQFAEGIISVADLDTTNLGFGIGTVGTNIVADVNTAAATPTGWTAGYTPTMITGAAATTLANTLAAASGLANNDPQVLQAISKIDYAANQAGVPQADVNSLLGATGVLNLALAGTGDINSNKTAIFTGGFTVAEVPLSIGVALNDNISVGGNLKLIVGRVAAAKVRMLDKVDELATLMENAFDEAEQTVTGGVDLGVVARCSWAQVGVTGRNLNRPMLKGGVFKDGDGQSSSVDDVALEPQVAVGLALYPFETVVLTADMDLTRNSTTISTTSNRTDLPVATSKTLEVEYATQRLGGGLEWNIARFLALRGGYSTDLAETDAGGMIHAGVGLNLWALRLDIAGAVSTETVQVDGEEVPRAASVSAGLTMDF